MVAPQVPQVREPRRGAARDEEPRVFLEEHAVGPGAERALRDDDHGKLASRAQLAHAAHVPQLRQVRAGAPEGGEARVAARRRVLDDDLGAPLQRRARHVDGEVDEGVVLAHELLGHGGRVGRAALVLEGPKADVHAAVQRRLPRATENEVHGVATSTAA